MHSPVILDPDWQSARRRLGYSQYMDEWEHGILAWSFFRLLRFLVCTYYFSGNLTLLILENEFLKAICMTRILLVVGVTPISTIRYKGGFVVDKIDHSGDNGSGRHPSSTSIFFPIKPAHLRSENQKLAHFIFGFNERNTANTAIQGSLFIEGKALLRPFLSISPLCILIVLNILSPYFTPWI